MGRKNGKTSSLIASSLFNSLSRFPSLTCRHPTRDRARIVCPHPRRMRARVGRLSVGAIEAIIEQHRRRARCSHHRRRWKLLLHLLLIRLLLVVLLRCSSSSVVIRLWRRRRRRKRRRYRDRRRRVVWRPEERAARLGRARGRGRKWNGSSRPRQLGSALGPSRGASGGLSTCRTVRMSARILGGKRRRRAAGDGAGVLVRMHRRRMIRSADRLGFDFEGGAGRRLLAAAAAAAAGDRRRLNGAGVGFASLEVRRAFVHREGSKTTFRSPPRVEGNDSDSRSFFHFSSFSSEGFP